MGDRSFRDTGNKLFRGFGVDVDAVEVLRPVDGPQQTFHLVEVRVDKEVESQRKISLLLAHRSHVVPAVILKVVAIISSGVQEERVRL